MFRNLLQMFILEISFMSHFYFFVRVGGGMGQQQHSSLQFLDPVFLPLFYTFQKFTSQNGQVDHVSNIEFIRI